MVYRFGVLLIVVIYVSSSTALPPCVCTRNFKPVCGSDGVTYANECLLRCQKQNNVDLTVVKEDECNAQPPCVCTLEYAPVCGTNGVTYPNKCSMTCERSDIGIAYRGECRTKREDIKVNQTPCLCTREAKFVCGTDGRTYSNPCMLNCAKQTNEDLQMDHYGKCNKVGVVNISQSCSCTREMSIVCASNGVTYNNMCLMKCAGQDLTVEKYGPC